MTKPDGNQPQPNAESIPSLHGNVDFAVQKYMRSTKSVGLAVGVITEGESLSFFYGSKGSDGSAAPDEKTIFEIRSITKVVTTTVLADMHLKNEVHLDDSVNKHFAIVVRC